MCSNASTTRANIRPTLIHASFENTILTKNSMWKVLRNLRKYKQFDLFICKWQQSMIVNNIKIFLQNVCKNNLVINTILETQYKFDIIFIQELSWLYKHFIPSPRNIEGEELVGVPNYSN